jgi:xylulose-5-phosphate/fructose-6-phosphate phosphoketolase
MRSYRPEELFNSAGRLRPEIAALAPSGPRRMGANPHANGGQLLCDLVMPDFSTYGVSVHEPGATDAEGTRVLGRWLRDVVTYNAGQRNFRVFGPDETVSNRLDAVFEATSRQWMGEQTADDEWLAPRASSG